MAAVARRPQMNGIERNGATPANNQEGHELDDLDAALLQTFIAKRVLYLENAIDILSTLADVTESEIEVDQDTLEEAVSRVNVAIHDFDFEIKKSLAQANGNPLWAIVNTTSDSFTQLSTTHSPSEIAYLRVLLTAMFDTANSTHEEVFAIRSSEAINLSSTQGVGLTKTAGEAAIRAFIKEGWLEKSRAGFISLSERGLLELRSYLTEMFDDVEEDGETRTEKRIRNCQACQEIITQGQRCATLRCPVRFHNHCAETFFSPRNTVCPTCKTPWKDHLPVGEAACSDRSRRRVSNRQRDARSESRESQRSMTQTSSRSSRSRSPTLRRSSAESLVGRRSSRQGSRRTSTAQSIQEDGEDEDVYG